MTPFLQTANRFAPVMRVGTLGLFGRLGHAVRRTAARQQLLALDERMLRDIGLSRADVDSNLF